MRFEHREFFHPRRNTYQTQFHHSFELLEERRVLTTLLELNFIEDAEIANDASQESNSRHERSADAATREFYVRQTPRLQLGNAPLNGFPGSEFDQVEVLWQTETVNPDAHDEFIVEYRRTNEALWSNAIPIDTLETHFDSRIIHNVVIGELDFNTEYEYRVRHMSEGDELSVYQSTFRTRLIAGDESEFRFVAYGDSADIDDLDGFRAVQSRINNVNPNFAVLTGDNVYPDGSHDDFDARFDPNLVPAATEWISSHIDFPTIGNHEEHAFFGQPHRDSFSLPIPSAGVSSPSEPPMTEREEHNYSFDYGNTHFVTFDTNSYDQNERLDELLSYVEADLAASTAQWNIVFGHHPVSGAPDKNMRISDNYFRQVVPRLREAGADVLLVGHSHTSSWSYPLVGNQRREVSFVLDEDKDYSKGAGLVQVVSGTGGGELRAGDFEQYDFIASGYSLSTAPAVEHGFVQFDVSANQLAVAYIAADDGATIDSFTITDHREAASELADVDAGADRSVESLTDIALQGIINWTNDSDEQDRSINWSLANGPDFVVFTDPASENTRFSVPRAGEYLLRLTVSDGVVESFDEVRIIVDLPNTFTTDFRFGVDDYYDTIDAEIVESSPTTNFGSEQEIHLGGSERASSLHRWDVSQIPNGATVVYAGVTLRGESGVGRTVEMYEVTRPWNETEVTFQNADSETPWGQPGLGSDDRGSTVVGTGMFSAVSSQAYHEIFFNPFGHSLIEKWINDPTSNHGVYMTDRDVDESQITFFASETGRSISPELTVTWLLPTNPFVVDRQIFYNNSSYDGYDPSANSNDDQAIDSYKTALLPGEVASSANYTNYLNGINGIMVDISQIPLPQKIGVDDFRFRMGNDNFPSAWAAAPLPMAAVRVGEGKFDSFRISLIWNDTVIQNTWLEITVIANESTGLVNDEVFYFGNAVGDVATQRERIVIDDLDTFVVGRNFRHFLLDTGIFYWADINRDQIVNGTDFAIARDHQTTPETEVILLDLRETPKPNKLRRISSESRRLDDMGIDAVLRQFDRSTIRLRPIFYRI